MIVATKTLASNALSFMLRSVKNRQVGANEAADRLLGHKLFSKSRQVRFADLVSNVRTGRLTDDQHKLLCSRLILSDRRATVAEVCRHYEKLVSAGEQPMILLPRSGARRGQIFDCCSITSLSESFQEEVCGRLNLELFPADPMSTHLSGSLAARELERYSTVQSCATRDTVQTANTVCRCSHRTLPRHQQT